MPRDGKVLRQVANPARGLRRVRVLGMRDADHAIAGLEAGHGASRSDHLARGFAAELLRQRERRAAGKLVARQIASPVLHVPARHRAGVVLHQDVAIAEGRQRIIAEDELLGPAVFE